MTESNLTTAGLADLLDRAEKEIREKSRNVRADFSSLLLSAECGKAAYALRQAATPTPKEG